MRSRSSSARRSPPIACARTCSSPSSTPLSPPRTRLPAVTEGALRYAAAIGDAGQQLAQALAASASLGKLAHEVKAIRDRMVYPGFLIRTPWERLEHLPRYLKGYALRLQKYRANAERDQKHAATVAAPWGQYEGHAKEDTAAGRPTACLE